MHKHSRLLLAAWFLLIQLFGPAVHAHVGGEPAPTAGHLHAHFVQPAVTAEHTDIAHLGSCDSAHEVVGLEQGCRKRAAEPSQNLPALPAKFPQVAAPLTDSGGSYPPLVAAVYPELAHSPHAPRAPPRI